MSDKYSLERKELDKLKDKFEENRDKRRLVTKERIRKLMEERNIKNKELAKEIKMYNTEESNEAKLSACISTKNLTKEFDVDTLIIISKAYKVSMNWLLGILDENCKNDRNLSMVRDTTLSEKSIENLTKLKKELTKKELDVECAEGKVIKDLIRYDSFIKKAEIINYLLENMFDNDGIVSCLEKLYFPNFKEVCFTTEFGGTISQNMISDNEAQNMFLFSLNSAILKDKENFKKNIKEYEENQEIINEAHTKAKQYWSHYQKNAKKEE